MTDKTIHEILLRQIKVSGENVRRTERKKDLEELAESIRKNGLLQPVVLLGKKSDTPPYKLIVGQRRFFAHQHLKKSTIEAVFAGDLSPTEAAILSLSENMLRVELNHADAAEAITDLYKKLGKKIQAVQRETGMSRYRIVQYLDIKEQASQKMMDKVSKNQVRLTDVKRVLRASKGDKKKADDLLDLMEKHKLTKYQKERLVDYGEAHPAAKAKKILEESLPPRVEESVLVKINEPMRKGLEKAASAYSEDLDVVAARALSEWLSEKGFMSE